MTDKKPRVVYALAGRVVSRSEDARLIWRKAIESGSEWLIPQAFSVAKKLAAVGQ